VSDIIVIQPDENNVVVSQVTNSITTASGGPQGPAGPTGATGATGATGPAGSSGVVAVTAPITNSGTSSSANIGISTGTTSAVGALQLTDSVASTSTTTAATPNAVKTSYDLANLRAPIIKRGSTVYFSSPMQGAANFTVVNETAYYTPIYIDQSTTVDRIAVRTASTFSGTATLRLGIYNYDSATGRPSTVLLDAGTVSATAASTNYQITISQSLSTGFYFVVVCQQGTAPTTGAYLANNPAGTTNNIIVGTTSAPNTNTIIGFSQTSVTGAFATASGTSNAQQSPYVWLRTA